MKAINKNVGIIVTARTNSSRLPQKALQEINGKTSIEILLDHVINDKYPVVLAIPENPNDDILAEIAEKKGVEVYRGQDDSPLHRIYECAVQNDFETIVRITSDDILIDLTLLFLQIDFHTRSKRDYTFLRQCPEGIAGEVFSFKTIEKIVEKHGDAPVEFISYYAKEPGFNCIEFYPPYEYKWSFRLTLDYEEDLTLLRILFSLLKKPGTLDIINLLKQNKYLLRVNKLPKITIITPAYNVEKYIRKTIVSVLSQTFTDYEYIIIDDGSADKTSEVIGETLKDMSYADRRKIQYMRNSENKGQAYTSNQALVMAKGKYIMCLDSDDTLEKNALQVMYDTIEENNDDCIMAGYFLIDENGKVIEEVPENAKHLGCSLISRRLVNELKFRENIKYQIGADFLERLKNNCTIVYYNGALWNYRRREGQLTQQKDHPEYDARP